MIKLKTLIEDTIQQSLQKRRKSGGCGMLKYVGIPYLVKMGKWDTLYDWEKEHFLKGVERGYWDKKGNLIKKDLVKKYYSDYTNSINEYLRLRVKGNSIIE